jgi:hypothetical protein
MGRDDPLKKVQRANFVGWLWVVALLAGLCGASVFAGCVFAFGLGCLASRIASFATGKRAAINSGEQSSADALRRRGNPPRLTILSERLRDKVTRADVRVALDEHASGEWGCIDECLEARNYAAANGGGRVVSLHRASGGVTFCVVSENNATSICLPTECSEFCVETSGQIGECSSDAARIALTRRRSIRARKSKQSASRRGWMRSSVDE